MNDNPENVEKDRPLKVRIEHLSFDSHGKYMDVEAHADYVDITIGGTENEKFSVTLDDWKIIDVEVRKLLKQG
jgi:hypothetical protein